MKKNIFVTNGGNGIFTSIGDDVYYLNDGSLGVDTSDINFLNENLKNKWDLENFEILGKNEFFSGLEETFELSEWIEILKV